MRYIIWLINPFTKVPTKILDTGNKEEFRESSIMYLESDTFFSTRVEDK